MTVQYIWISYLQPESDDPSDTYAELDNTGRERRRVDFYQNGMCFSYGCERGRTEVLSAYPENPCTLSRSGEMEVRLVPPSAFEQLWDQAQEWPSGFMDVLS